MSNLHTLISHLRKKGYRITPQREMIVQIIAESSDHMTAEEIYAQIRTRTQALNLATVYRTLDMLVEEGLATRVDLEEGKICYATAAHGNHIHLVCRGCGCIIDADPELLAPLQAQLQADYAFFPDLQHVAFFGNCPKCKKESS